MDEIFIPSLLISIGPSGKRALAFSQHLMETVPREFLNLIEFYHVESMENLNENLQSIIDNKLLLAKNLNSLVDKGYKVRSESLSAVKVNVYLLMDVYEGAEEALQVIDKIYKLSFGNIDKEQHTGASLFILSMVEKEWIVGAEEPRSVGESLNKIIEYISSEKNMLALDSKLFITHCIANDGTRIPKAELETTCGSVVYFNVLPSKESPLSIFHKRIMKEEANYKVGTIGLTSLTIFKERLLEDFSRYLSMAILNHAIRFQDEVIFESYRGAALVDYKTIRDNLVKNVPLEEENGIYILQNLKEYAIKVPKNPLFYKVNIDMWKNYLENQLVEDLKRTIESNKNSFVKGTISVIKEEIREIVLNFSYKEAFSYLENLQEQIHKRTIKKRPGFNREELKGEQSLEIDINRKPSKAIFLINAILLATLFIYGYIILVFPFVKTFAMGTVITITAAILYILLVTISYLYPMKDLKDSLEQYEIMARGQCGDLVGVYLEKSIVEAQEELLKALREEQNLIEACINNCSKVSGNIDINMEVEEESLGNLTTDVLNSQDRKDFYNYQNINISSMYRSFIRELKSYKRIKEDDLNHIIRVFAKDKCRAFTDIDLYEYLIFKYNNTLHSELSDWIKKGLIKSKYLLQYSNRTALEEHTILLTSPKIIKYSGDILGNSLNKFNLITLGNKDIFTSNITIMRLCVGIDFNGISSIGAVRGGAKNA